MSIACADLFGTLADLPSTKKPMLTRLVKAILPDRPVNSPILSGPFRGARIRLNPRRSMRKIFGLYERELNGWIRAVLPRVDVLYDVGANDGYFTFGCLHWFLSHHVPANIFAFEPELHAFQSLTASAKTYQTSRLRIELVNKFVGDIVAEQTVTLDDFSTASDGQCPPGKALIKIDVEGAEEKVLRGAKTFMHPGNFFLVEIHSAELLKSVAGMFEERGLLMHLVSQQPLPLLGREHRPKDNWWLVSSLDGSRGR